MMNRIKILILSLMVFCWCGMNAQQKAFVDKYEADVKTYGTAVKKIVEQKKYREGIDILNTLLERVCNESDYPLTTIATYYKARALGYMKQSQYSASSTDYLKAIELLTQEGEKGKSDLSDTWYQLSLVYYYWGKQEETMMAANNCVSTAETYFGKQHSTTLEAYALRSNYEGFYNDKAGALSDRQVCFEIIQKNIERNFTYLTAQERTAYWNKYLPETSLLFTFGHKLNVASSEYTDVMFDQQLLAKGLLLTAESALQRTIDEDTNLQKIFFQIRLLRQKALDVNTLPADAETALREADNIERKLTGEANEVNSFLNFLSVRSSDIKKKLSINDIAVEFVDYRIGKDSIMYAALIQSPQYPHVQFVPLLEQKEIITNKNNVVDKVWQPILNAIGGKINRIYFAPAGVLYQIPIESHILNDGTPIGMKYNMYRLSSTRWLALGTNTTGNKKAALYGDLQYDTSIDEMQKNMMVYSNLQTSSGGQVRGASGLQGLPPLDATKVEINQISQVFSNNNYITSMFSGNRGTEASFKFLSGKQYSCVHIATHGFFETSANTTKDPLNRTGLYFAGADNALAGDDIPDNIEDGILTAGEASSLDLRGLDLLGLSACETGLGDVTPDGVFGLQRGFKKAGAISILMSLWKVDDAATCKLMTEFYTNWIGRKMTKHDALEAAKKTVRETIEWEDPKYWAAFILLDGLD